MNFDLTEDQEAIRESAKDFAERYLAPTVEERDKTTSGTANSSMKWMPMASPASASPKNTAAPAWIISAISWQWKNSPK